MPKDKRDADILSCNYERAMRVWSMHQQQRRDRALRRKKQITSNDVLSPVSPLILSMAPLVSLSADVVTTLNF